jgi:soluble lytic murein transglycosylase-like protein
MQLMPGTARQLGVADSFAPDQNVRGGTAYFDALLTRYHDNIALALAAYNAGPSAVDRYHGIPPYRETQLYVARVIHEFNRRVIARRSAARPNPVFAANQTAVTEQTISGNAGTGRD